MISRTDKIRLLQSMLLALGHQIAVDGDFGKGSAAALEAFKQKKELTGTDNLSNKVFEALANAVGQLFSKPDLPNDKLYNPNDKLYQQVVLKSFPKADKTFLSAVFGEINANRDMFQMESPLRQAHSLAQIKSECGSSFCIRENLNYSENALKGLFGYYRCNPKMAEKHGRTSAHKADQEAIANHAYAMRIGNGDIASGDGWRYRGRGIKQLTGKHNYADFTRWYAKYFSKTVDFVKQPDLLFEPKYAAASGAYFWVKHNLHLIADRGPTATTVNQITRVINRKLPKKNREQRVKCFTSIWKMLSV